MMDEWLRDGKMMKVRYLLCYLYCKWHCGCDVVVATV